MASLEELRLGGLTRRRFVVSSLAAGFAAAALPIRAESAISTPAEGLAAGEVKIPTGDGAMPAYRAAPPSGGPFPTVLVVQEVFGVHEHIRDVCRRFAKQGYLAIAPELYARQGDPSKIADVQQLVAEIVSKVPDAQVMSDLDAAAAWAEQNGGDGARLAVTGFCWGGRITWLYAAHGAKVKAGVAWYGRLATPSDPLHPKQPVDVAASLRAPVLGLYGGQDAGIPLADVEKMRAALAAAGKTDSEIRVYPDAPHGFHADYRPSYREADAKDGWDRTLAWFAKHGAA
jgi:carboxymethylenebutenolidase